jgi:hypothetical protein
VWQAPRVKTGLKPWAKVFGPFGAWSLDIREGFFQAKTDTPFPRLLCGPKRLGNLAQALRLGLRPEGPWELSPGFSHATPNARERIPTLRANESINLYVVTFDRNLQEDLKSKADTDFDRVPGNGGKKPVVKPRAPTEAVPIGGKGQPRNNN